MGPLGTLGSYATVADFERHAVHTVVSDNDFVFEIHEYRRGTDQLLFAHLRFFRFTPSVLKRVLREWTVFRQCVPAPLYAHCDDGDLDKWIRFVSLLGFRPTGETLSFISGEPSRPVFMVPNAHNPTHLH